MFEDAKNRRVTQKDRAPMTSKQTNLLSQSHLDETMRLMIQSSVPGPRSPSDFNNNINNNNRSSEIDNILFDSTTHDSEIGEHGRADSRDTYQSFQNGPALVEETTLTDLEDEINSTLLASKDAARQDHRRYLKDNSNGDQHSTCMLLGSGNDRDRYSNQQQAQNQNQLLSQMIRNDLTKYHENFIR